MTCGVRAAAEWVGAGIVAAVLWAAILAVAFPFAEGLAFP